MCAGFFVGLGLEPAAKTGRWLHLLSSAACAATAPAVEYRYAYDLMGNRTRAETITAGASQLTNLTPRHVPEPRSV